MPQDRLLSGWRFSTIQAGVSAMAQVMRGGLRPCVMRLYDEFDTLLALSGDHGSGPPGQRSTLPAQLLPDAVRNIGDSLRRRRGERGKGGGGGSTTLPGSDPIGIPLEFHWNLEVFGAARAGEAPFHSVPPPRCA